MDTGSLPVAAGAGECGGAEDHGGGDHGDLFHTLFPFILICCFCNSF